MSDEVLRKLVEAIAPLMDEEYCDPLYSAWELDDYRGQNGTEIYEKLRAAWEAARYQLGRERMTETPSYCTTRPICWLPKGHIGACRLEMWQGQPPPEWLCGPDSICGTVARPIAEC